MTLINANSPAVASLTPLDFSDSYRHSSTLQPERMTLPARDEVHAAVQAKMSIPPSLIDQAMTALAAGKHLLLYGPPGTGKTTFASLITDAYKCEAVPVTASADWTPFETAGGLQLSFEDDMETLIHQPGIITNAVVRCLNLIAEEKAGQPRDHQAAWLIIDEINRANMDAAFGPYFNALDADHPRVILPFMDEDRQEIYVPSRFRVIGTMNTYDKNFLFRMSYALTRRFALIEVGVPANDDAEARQHEGLGVLDVASQKLATVGVSKTADELGTSYEPVLLLLYDTLVTRIRDTDSDEGLGRGIGFAQIASAFVQTALAVELGYVDGPDDNAKQLAALDRGVASSIVPQLEGLPNSKLKAFTDWWAGEAELKKLTESLTAARALISGLDLFISEPG
jgi:MoxR-like ATPase